MRSRAPAPPRFAERILAAALGDGEWSESILGDLHEEHALRADSSPSRASAWYWLQACRLSATGAVARVRSSAADP